LVLGYKYELIMKKKVKRGWRGKKRWREREEKMEERWE
jgi:hypothetical protein